MGLISPVGCTLEALASALAGGQSGVRRLEGLPEGVLPSPIGAPAAEFTGAIDDFGPLGGEQKKAIRKGVKLMCRECQMGVAAAQRALSHAGLGEAYYPPPRAGVVFGCDYLVTVPDEFGPGIQQCTGADGKLEFGRWGTDGLPRLSPLWLLKYLPNMPASHVAIYNDFQGPNNSLTQREASGGLALGEAFHYIQRGAADVIVVGSTGSRVHPMKAVHAAQQEQWAEACDDPAMASRPFDARRTGMVVGEGAGALVLESLATAGARGATLYAEVVGSGSSSVARKPGVAHRELALANSLAAALASAGARPGEVGHVNAHGLATISCDVDEWRALERVLGPRARNIPVTAAKSYFGNLGAGSGLVELIGSVLALKAGRLFPILNFQSPDTECPVSAVRTHDVDPGTSFVKLSVSPQGQASCLMVRTVE
jgi:3-oxoacyl-[acyl-carrier-protein] synthase II